MKRLTLLSVVIIFLAFITLPQTGIAQNRPGMDEERSQKIQEAIKRQKRSMSEEQRALEDMNRDMYERQVEIEKILEDVDLEGLDTVINKKIRRSFRSTGDRPFEDQFVFSYGPGMDPYIFYHGSSDGEKTSWNFSKSVKESSFSKDYSFDVEKTVKSVSMSIMGDCKTGEIKIGIYMPGGRKYSDIILDESGNLNWRKSFSISDGDNDDKTGEWKFRISASKATGFFRISLQTL
jgi:hypothetical protein